MMKGLLKCFMMVCLLWAAPVDHVWAQTDAKQKPKVPETKFLSVMVGTLGSDTYIAIKRDAFINEAKSGLTVATGADKVTSFMVKLFTHNLYEDSIGNPIIMPDVFTQFNTGSLFEENLLQYFQNSLKVGDTLILDDIRITAADGTRAKGKDLKFAITR